MSQVSNYLVKKEMGNLALLVGMGVFSENDPQIAEQGAQLLWPKVILGVVLSWQRWPPLEAWILEPCPGFYGNQKKLQEGYPGPPPETQTGREGRESDPPNLLPNSRRTQPASKHLTAIQSGFRKTKLWIKFQRRWIQRDLILTMFYSHDSKRKYRKAKEKVFWNVAKVHQAIFLVRRQVGIFSNSSWRALYFFVWSKMISSKIHHHYPTAIQNSSKFKFVKVRMLYHNHLNFELPTEHMKTKNVPGKKPRYSKFQRLKYQFLVLFPPGKWLRE